MILLSRIQLFPVMLLSRTHILLSFNRNMIMKDENALCEKDSPPPILNASNFCEVVVW
jgi:hypothetical protein